MAGVYFITCSGDDLCYVGITCREFSVRFSEHRTKLKAGKHHNDRLQRSYNKYGQDTFEFTPIEEINDDSLLLGQEIYWVDYLRYIGANVANVADPGDYPIRYRDKISEKRKGQRPTETQKRNMSRVTSKKIYPNIVSPDGTIYSTEWLSEFCRIHGLEYSGVRKLLSGKMKSGHYKGWYVEGNKPDLIILANSKQPADRVLRRNQGCKKTVVLKGPDGAIHIITGLTEFAAKHSINYTSFYLLVRGKIKQHKGWTLVTEDEDKAA